MGRQYICLSPNITSPLDAQWRIEVSIMNSAVTSPASCDYLTRDADRRSLLTFLLISAVKRTAAAETYNAYRTYTVVFPLFVGLCCSVSSAVEWAVALTWRDRSGSYIRAVSSLSSQPCGPARPPGTAETSQKCKMWKPHCRSGMSKSRTCNG